MSCHICSCAQTPRPCFLCPTCARNQLYHLRVDNATILLEKEAIGQRIERAVKSNTSQETSPENAEVLLPGSNVASSKVWTIQAITNKQAESTARTKVLASEIENLGSKIKNRKFDISQRKLALAQRRSDSESAKYQLPEREAAMFASIQNNIKRTDHLWHSLHSKTAEARIFLCREAANLYGLRQKAKKNDTRAKEVYMIGGVNIIDLRDMNGKYSFASGNKLNINISTGVTSDHISTLFSYIAHLLVLVSHYLSLKLPAEITLPHRNYPTPTIYAPSSSYISREAYFSSSLHQSLSSNPAASRISDPQLHAPRPRPRPLSIDKPLPKLAREDPGTYAHFLEGATLLAWNVSWLCRSQGLHLGSDSWEDICDIGKNMWQLLVAPPAQPSTLARALAGRDMQAKIKASKDSPRTTIQRTMSFPMLGHYSHGTTHSFLYASEGTEFIRSWRLPTPTKVADKLKSTLLGEMASAEWELLEEKEWDDAAEEAAHPPSHKPSNLATSASGATRVRSEAESLVTKPESPESPSSSPRPRGTSGWTKLRSRQ